jgi:FolB domain-containing protein
MMKNNRNDGVVRSTEDSCSVPALSEQFRKKARGVKADRFSSVLTVKLNGRLGYWQPLPLLPPSVPVLYLKASTETFSNRPPFRSKIFELRGKTKTCSFSTTLLANSLANLVMLGETYEDVDVIKLQDLTVSANIGPDCWGRDRSQPLLISVSFYTDESNGGLTDDIKDCLDYSTLAKKVLVFFERNTQFSSMMKLALDLGPSLRKKYSDNSVRAVDLIFKAPKAALRAEETVLKTTFTDNAVGFVDLLFKGIQMALIIGVNAAERDAKQRVSVAIHLRLRPTYEEAALDYMNARLTSIVEVGVSYDCTCQSA